MYSVRGTRHSNKYHYFQEKLNGEVLKDEKRLL